MNDKERAIEAFEKGLQPESETEEFEYWYGKAYAEQENATAKLIENEKVNHYEC